MNYEAFFETLGNLGWKVRGKSYAFLDVSDDWQWAFIRLGGRFHRSGHIGFVVCVRHRLNRNLDGKVCAENTEPHAYPYKFTIDEIANADFEYRCKLEHYPLTYLPTDSDWKFVETILTEKLRGWIDNHSPVKLRNEIERNGESGYIEKLWIEDLRDAV